ncbi:hypothetical protein [Exiguobacterium himgiriensis]|uniref:hypothetical protein n=2 Tax=Exiguobacterium TaxID=33986 RepID=UPI0021AF30F1|nr:hypothetical protein [Exiguobacterium himgiriensis]
MMIRGRRLNKLYVSGIGLILLLTGCAASEDVVQYEYVASHWTAERMMMNESVQQVDPKTILTQCEEQELVSEIEEETLTMLGIAYATRMPFSEQDGTTYAFTQVAYVEGESLYALCQSNHLESYRAVKLETRPDFLKDEEGIKVPMRPQIESATDEARETLQRKDSIYEDGQGQKIRPFTETLMTISPSFNGTIEFGVGDEGIYHPYFDFAPYLVKHDTNVALGYDVLTNEAYMLLSHDGRYYGTYPIQDSDLVQGVDHISVRVLADEKILEPLQPFPLYELTLEIDGQVVTKTVSIRFQSNALLQEPSEVEPVSLAYLHRFPYQPNVPFHYPDAISLNQDAHTRLIEALNDANPTKRVGDSGAYNYLTLFQGNRSQQFELSYHKRSSKVDVYVKEIDSAQQFKLTSEGAETFRDVFPQAFE